MTLFLAMLLDALLGEPRWLWSRVPHPAVLMGKAIDWADQTLNTGSGKRAKGVLTVFGICTLGLCLGVILQALPGQVIDVIAVAILIAQRSLVDHMAAVANGLKAGVDAGRQAVAQIVGRDTAQMDEAQIARAAIESGAENLSDGVIAPIFWFLVGGLPGILIYKWMNTADSMIGYLTPRHAEFGWAAARLDDLLNFVPARITAGLIMLGTLRWDIADRVWDDAPGHRSPNAGWPEAALAHAKNFALSGPRVYDGELRDYAFVNPDGIRDLRGTHIMEAIRTLWAVWAIVLTPAALLTLVALW